MYRINYGREYKSPSLHDLLKRSEIWKNHNIPEVKKRKLVIKEHIDKYNERLIHNLSEYNLTKEEHHLLCKGLNYSPNIPQFKFASNPIEVYENLRRHVDIKIHFTDNQEDQNQQDDPHNNRNTISKLPKKRKSDWTPPPSENDTINQFFHHLHNTELQPRPLEPRQHQHIMTPYNSLLNDPTIIIKKADKGGGLVILNKNDYIMNDNFLRILKLWLRNLLYSFGRISRILLSC